MRRQELVEQLAQAAERVASWPEWKQTMFDRTVQAEQYFAERPQASNRAAAGSGESSRGEKLPSNPF
jgi:hypothetical protein